LCRSHICIFTITQKEGFVCGTDTDGFTAVAVVAAAVDVSAYISKS